MKASFAEIHRRLDGATEDLNALLAEMQAWMDAHRAEIPRIGRRGIGTPPVYIGEVYVESVATLPSHWDRRVAHILYDARSALDHLIGELYVASTGRRPPPKIARNHQFPICATWARWDAAIGAGYLAGLDARFVSMIRARQPMRSKARTRQVLARLQRFNNADKHRRPSLVLVNFEEFHVKAQSLDESALHLTHVEAGPKARTLRVGAVLARIHGVGRPGFTGLARVEVSTEGSAYPSLAGGARADHLCGAALQSARAIVNECEAALKEAL